MHPHNLLVSIITRRALDRGAIEVFKPFVDASVRRFYRIRFLAEEMPPITDDDSWNIYMAAAHREAELSTKH